MRVVLNLVEPLFILYHLLQKLIYSAQLQKIQRVLSRKLMLTTTLTKILKLQDVVLDTVQHQLLRKITMMTQLQLLMVQYLRRLQPSR